MPSDFRGLIQRFQDWRTSGRRRQAAADQTLGEAMTDAVAALERSGNAMRSVGNAVVHLSEAFGNNNDMLHALADVMGEVQELDGREGPSGHRVFYRTEEPREARQGDFWVDIHVPGRAIVRRLNDDAWDTLSDPVEEDVPQVDWGFPDNPVPGDRFLAPDNNLYQFGYHPELERVDWLPIDAYDPMPQTYEEPPSDPHLGDIATVNGVRSYWDGGDWIPISFDGLDPEPNPENFDFPDDPARFQTFNAPNGNTYVWNGDEWINLSITSSDIHTGMISADQLTLDNLTITDHVIADNNRNVANSITTTYITQIDLRQTLIDHGMDPDMADRVLRVHVVGMDQAVTLAATKALSDYIETLMPNDTPEAEPPTRTRRRYGKADL